MISGGKLRPTAGHWQCGDGNDAAVVLDSALDMVASMIVPRNDYEADCLSHFAKAVGTQGNTNFGVFANGRAAEPNGELNGDTIPCHADMTGASSPSPLVADATSTTTTYYPWKAFNTDTADGWVSGTDPAVTPQNLVLDLGSGNATIVNKVGIVFATPVNNPEDFSFWGSNLVSPNKDTDGDWTQLASYTGEAHTASDELDWYQFTNPTAYRHYRMQITASETAAICRVEDMYLIEAQSLQAPDFSTQLTNYGALNTTATGWSRLVSENGHQFKKGILVWLVQQGSNGVDVSASIRNVHSGRGSEPMPEVVKSVYSTDGGDTWSQCLQDDRPAFWNVIVGSEATHVPQVVLGRASGTTVEVDGEDVEIPEEGVYLPLSALDEISNGEVPLNVYAYLDNEVLTLEAVVTARAFTNHVEHKSGAVDHTFLGLVAPREVQTGYQGAVGCGDMQLIANKFNERVRLLTKRNAYTSDTSQSVTANAGVLVSYTDAFDVEAVTLDDIIELACTGMTNASGCVLQHFGFGGLVDDRLSSLAAAYYRGAANKARNRSFNETMRVYWALENIHASITQTVYYFRPLSGSSSGKLVIAGLARRR